VIASVTGTVQGVRLDSGVIDVGGVGLLVYATPTTLATLAVGRSATLATSLVVREDSLTLFGFSESEERDVFETLLTVSGIGPRLALSMLAVHSPENLRQAVAREDLAALQRVPGIGRKGAQRLVLELADRLGAPGGTASLPQVPDRRGEVVEALMSLGWTQKVAQSTVDAVSGEQPVEDVAQVLRSALRSLGGDRG
jgi:holliday junction DNA helicase RuvA